MILFHGSSTTIEKPSLFHAREDASFGVGFYLTENELIAKKWATCRARSVVNKYEIDISTLKVFKYSLDLEWLRFVKANRMMENTDEKDPCLYDVVIGPDPESVMFDPMFDYISGVLPENEALKRLSKASLVNQVVLKTEKAFAALHFVEAYVINKEEKEDLKVLVQCDRMKSI